MKDKNLNSFHFKRMISSKTRFVIIAFLVFLSVYLPWLFMTQAPAVTNNTYYRVDPEHLILDRSVGPLPKGFQDAFDHLRIVKGQSLKSSKVILLTSLDRVDQMLSRIPLHAHHIVHALRGSDWMACKARLYIMMQHHFKNKYHSPQMVHEYFPMTYVLHRQEDIDILLETHARHPDTIYILKKNVQRQRGYILSQNVDEIVQHSKDAREQKNQHYVVCQELLQDPYLVNGRKINMRVYLLIIMKNREIPQFYIYNDGFMYYTPKPFEAKSMDKDVNITTGYIDRQVYADNPLTHHDLAAFIGAEAYTKLHKKMLELFKHIREAYALHLRDVNTMIPGTKFLLYGCDIAPSSNLETVRLMEINKGPDLSYKDERDKKVKYNMILEMLRITGISDTGSTEGKFIAV